MRHTLRGAIPLAAAALLGLGACVSLDTPTQGGNCGATSSIAVGVARLDSLTRASCRLTDQTFANVYQFRVDSQAKLLLTLGSPGGPVISWLTDSSGAMLANSLVTQAADTSVTMRLILRPGTYQVVVNTYTATPTGPLRLTVALDSAAVAGPTSVVWLSPSVATAQTITSGDHKDGPLGTKYYYHLYLRWVQAGGVLQLTEHSTAFTPGAQVVSLQGPTVATASLDSTLTDAKASYTSPTADILLLWIGTRDSLQTGAYTLTIN